MILQGSFLLNGYQLFTDFSTFTVITPNRHYPSKIVD